MTRLVLLAVLGLAACATQRPPEVLLACPEIDTTALRRCQLPAWLPQDGGDAVLELWERLALCVDAAQDAARQIERARE